MAARSSNRSNVIDASSRASAHDHVGIATSPAVVLGPLEDLPALRAATKAVSVRAGDHVQVPTGSASADVLCVEVRGRLGVVSVDGHEDAAQQMLADIQRIER